MDHPHSQSAGPYDYIGSAAHARQLQNDYQSALNRQRNESSGDRVAGWNEAVRLMQPRWDQLSATCDAQRERIAYLENLVASNLAATKSFTAESIAAIDDWKNHSNVLKEKAANLNAALEAERAKNVELSVMVTHLQEANSRVTARLTELQASNELLTEAHEEQMQLHERSVIFINSVVDTLSTILSEPTPAAEALKEQFNHSYHLQLQAAMELGVVGGGLTEDKLFAKKFPETRQVILHLLSTLSEPQHAVPKTPEPEVVLTYMDVDYTGEHNNDYLP